MACFLYGGAGGKRDWFIEADAITSSGAEFDFSKFEIGAKYCIFSYLSMSGLWQAELIAIEINSSTSVSYYPSNKAYLQYYSGTYTASTTSQSYTATISGGKLTLSVIKDVANRIEHCIAVKYV